MRSWVALAWFVLACSTTLVAACSSTPLGDPEPQSADELAAAFAAAVCKSEARCCSHAGFDFDLATCKVQMAEQLQQEVDEYDGLRVDFDPAAAAACIDDYATGACPEMPVVDYDVKRNCELMFRGRLAPGAACTIGDECRQELGRNATCDFADASAVEGTCVLARARVRAKLGEPCADSCRESASISGGVGCTGPISPIETAEGDSPTCYSSDGLFCMADGNSWTCQPLLALGDSCVGRVDCSLGAFCNPETGLCEAQRASGSCVEDYDACTADTVCDLDTQECLPSGKRWGQSCGSAADCASGYCNPSNVCQEPPSAMQCTGPIGLN